MRTAMSVKCAECNCAPKECTNYKTQESCVNCTREVCCCSAIHRTSANTRINLVSNDDCCASGTRESKVQLQGMSVSQSVYKFFQNVKCMYAVALGIEILCIAAAETGENTGFYFFGFNQIGIPFGYAMGYALATFTTFTTILGRYQYGGSADKIDSCCSALEQDENRTLLSNITTTFKNFGSGVRKLRDLHKQPNMKEIVKSSLRILVTAETTCIITAETVDLIFYRHALYLSIPLALLAGAFAVAAPEAYRKMRRNN